MGRVAIVDGGVVQRVIVAESGYRPAQGTAVELTQGQDVQPGDTYDGTFRRPDLTPEEKAARDAWASRQAVMSIENQARASRRALLRVSLNNWDALTAAQQSTVIRNTFPALVRELRELLGEEP